MAAFSKMIFDDYVVSYAVVSRWLDNNRLIYSLCTYTVFK